MGIRGDPVAWADDLLGPKSRRRTSPPHKASSTGSHAILGHRKAQAAAFRTRWSVALIHSFHL